MATATNNNNTSDPVTQPALFVEATEMRQQFDEFIEKHPEMWAEFVRYCRTLKFTRGFKHYSARTIISVMRFHSDVDSRPGDQFKINNNWSPYFARKLIEEDARFAGFFEFRKVKGEEVVA